MLGVALILILIIIILYKLNNKNWHYKDDVDFHYPNVYQTVLVQYIQNDKVCVQKGQYCGNNWKIDTTIIEDITVLAWTNVC